MGQGSVHSAGIKSRIHVTISRLSEIQLLPRLPSASPWQRREQRRANVEPISGLFFQFSGTQSGSNRSKNPDSSQYFDPNEDFLFSAPIENKHVNMRLFIKLILLVFADPFLMIMSTIYYVLSSCFSLQGSINLL